MCRQDLCSSSLSPKLTEQTCQLFMVKHAHPKAATAASGSLHSAVTHFAERIRHAFHPLAAGNTRSYLQRELQAKRLRLCGCPPLQSGHKVSHL